MDTMADEATYAWALEDHRIRVSLGDNDSDTYFQATLNANKSQYAGTWHYPDDRPSDATEEISYTRGARRRLSDGNAYPLLPGLRWGRAPASYAV